MNPLDRFLGWLSPGLGASRARARAQMQALERMGTYPQATPGRRDGPIFARGASADFTLEQGLDRRKVVDRARELERTNVLAEGLLSRSTEAVIGDGFTLQWNSGDEALDEEIEARWADWCENDADSRGLLTFSEILAGVYRSELRDGDVATLMQSDGSLRIIESDEIANPTGGYTAPNMVDGVELDSRGRPIAFHVFSWDPNVIWSDRRTAIPRLVRIPAKNVIFNARRLRLGQTRGISAFTNLFWILEQVMDSVEAVTVAMRMAACFGLVIKQNGPMFDATSTTDQRGTTKPSLSLEPGMWKRLEPGEEIEQVQPLHPGANFDSHVENLVRFAGVPFGLPLEITLRKFDKSNFSNTRAAMLQTWHTWSRAQKSKTRYASTIAMWKVGNWYPELLNDEKRMRHAWQTPGWPWLDPVAEIQAAQLEIDAGFTSPQRVIARHGGDWKKILEERKEWQDLSTQEEIPLTRSNLSRDPGLTPDQQIEMADKKAKQAEAAPPGAKPGAPPSKP